MSPIPSIKFEQAPNFCSSHPFITLNVGERDFGVDINPNLFMFNIDQYNLTIVKDPIIFSDAFRPVNKFLATLTDDEVRAFVLAYVHMQNQIIHNCNNREQFQTCLQLCAQTIIELNKEIGLSDKLFKYTEAHIPIDDMSQSGFRPQDSAQMTFGQVEVCRLTSIALLCKMFAPLFSELMSLGKNKKYSVKGFIESDCANIIIGVLESHHNLILKLKFYVEALITNVIKKLVDTATSAYHGQTDSSLLNHTLATIFLKKFVTENIYGGNITKAITTAARTGAKSQYDNARSRLDVNKRSDPEESESEEGNLSRMENESKPSKYSGDFSVILNQQTTDAYEDIIKRYNFDHQLVDAAYEFYRHNATPLNSISLFLMTNYFGELFGGGKSMEYLFLPAQLRLMSLMQLIMHQVYGSTTLMHALAMRKSDKLKVNIPIEDRQLSLTWTSGNEYKRCNDEFPQGFGEKTWDDQPKKIVEELVTANMLYNTAPVYWDLIGTASQNGQLVQEMPKIVKDMLILLHHIFTKEPGQL